MSDKTFSSTLLHDNDRHQQQQDPFVNIVIPSPLLNLTIGSSIMPSIDSTSTVNVQQPTSSSQADTIVDSTNTTSESASDPDPFSDTFASEDLSNLQDSCHDRIIEETIKVDKVDIDVTKAEVIPDPPFLVTSSTKDKKEGNEANAIPLRDVELEVEDVDGDHKLVLHRRVWRMLMRRLVGPVKLVHVVTGFLVLIVFVVVGILFWPKFPTMTVQTLTFDTESGSAASVTVPDSGNLNQMTLDVRFILTVMVFNENYYDITVDAVNLQTWLAINQSEIQKNPSPVSLNLDSIIGPPPSTACDLSTTTLHPPPNNPLLGTGSLSKTHTPAPITFPRRSSIPISVSLTISYTPNQYLGLLRDPIFAEILNVCGITSNRRYMRVDYEAVGNVVGIVGWVYKPVVKKFVFVGCPVDEDVMERVVDVISSNVNGNGGAGVSGGGDFGDVGAGNGSLSGGGLVKEIEALFV
ncbi:hypothetical protein HDU76_002330 [Blyttiomyces sp. JEL0837]|nr:hypothetical protein HDU76_002330 [Blyttiomyces sp. JEL0837]